MTLYFGTFGFQSLNWSMNQRSSCPKVRVNLFAEMSWHNVKLIPDVAAGCGHMQCLYTVAGSEVGNVAYLWQLSINLPSITSTVRTCNVGCYWQVLEKVLFATALSWLVVARSVAVPIYNIIYVAANMISVCYSHCIGKWTRRGSVGEMPFVVASCYSCPHSLWASVQPRKRGMWCGQMCVGDIEDQNFGDCSECPPQNYSYLCEIFLLGRASYSVGIEGCFSECKAVGVWR